MSESVSVVTDSSWSVVERVLVCSGIGWDVPAVVANVEVNWVDDPVLNRVGEVVEKAMSVLVVSVELDPVVTSSTVLDNMASDVEMVSNCKVVVSSINVDASRLVELC